MRSRSSGRDRPGDEKPATLPSVDAVGDEHTSAVRQVAAAELPTRFGRFEIRVFEVPPEPTQPVVFLMGEPASAAAPLVRIHSSCFTGDLIASLRCDCGDQLQLALQTIGEEGVGVVVYLHQEGRGIGLAEKIKAYALQDHGLDTVDANLALGHVADARNYTVAIRILAALGLPQIRLMTNNPRKVDAFADSPLPVEVAEVVPIVSPSNEHNGAYLATKRDRLSHDLPENC